MISIFTSSRFFYFLVLCIPLGDLFSGELQENLSYSKQKIHLLSLLHVREISPEKRLIFLHIPKTAGTNLDNFSKMISRNKGGFHYQRFSVPRVSGRSPVLITSGWIGGLQSIQNNPNILDKIPETFFLTGHFPFGLHRYFSNSCKYVTLVRHPLQREISNANFSYQRGYIQEEEYEHYLLNEMIDNPQVRLIAGVEYMEGDCSEKTFEKAKENIERYFFLAAPTDDADLFFQVIASIQKWGSLAYAPMQVTGEKVVTTPDQILSLDLLEKHQWDLKLYQWVKERWRIFKEENILGVKKLENEESILTLMPDFLSTREAYFFTLNEINEYNDEYDNETLLQLIQNHKKEDSHRNGGVT